MYCFPSRCLRRRLHVHVGGPACAPLPSSCCREFSPIVHVRLRAPAGALACNHHSICQLRTQCCSTSSTLSTWCECSVSCRGLLSPAHHSKSHALREELTAAPATCCAQSTMTNHDMTALFAIYDATNGAGWHIKDGWGRTATDPCSGLYGVTCTDGRVTDLCAHRHASAASSHRHTCETSPFPHAHPPPCPRAALVHAGLWRPTPSPARCRRRLGS